VKRNRREGSTVHGMPGGKKKRHSTKKKRNLPTAGEMGTSPVSCKHRTRARVMWPGKRQTRHITSAAEEGGFFTVGGRHEIQRRVRNPVGDMQRGVEFQSFILKEKSEPISSPPNISEGSGVGKGRDPNLKERSTRPLLSRESSRRGTVATSL